MVIHSDASALFRTPVDEQRPAGDDWVVAMIGFAVPMFVCDDWTTSAIMVQARESAYFP
jgi:hypothetical protein